MTRPTRIVPVGALALLAVLLTSAALLPATGNAQDGDRRPVVEPRQADELPDDREPFPACGPDRTSFCIVDVGIDPDGDGIFEALPPEIEPQVELWSSFTDRDSMNVALGRPLGAAAYPTELDPWIPAGTVVRIEVNSGSWEPPEWMTASQEMIEWSRSRGPAGWTQVFLMRTGGSSLTAGDDGCTLESCDVDLATVTFRSRAVAVVWGLPRPDDPQALADLELQTGSWIATNASSFSWGYYDSQAQSVVYELAGPHRTVDGDLNEGYFAAFLPDAFVTAVWGVDPEALAANDGLVLVNRDGGETERITVDVQHVDGGIRVEYRDFHYSSPDLTLQARRRLRAPRSIEVTGARGRAIVEVSPIRGAQSYQASCTRGTRVRTAENDDPRIVVRGLTRGQWTCEARGVRSTAGLWSDPTTVRVLPPRR